MEPSLLGEGSFGCVFTPSIPCESDAKSIRKTSKKEKTPYVGKVFAERKEFAKEVRMSKTAAKVDPQGKSILIPVSYCKTSRKHVEKHPASKDCDMLREFPYQSPNKPMYQLVMPYGGERLDRYFRKRMQAETPSTLAEALGILNTAFEGLVLLDQHKMCHQDIKSSNVLVTPEGKAILIDYSLMIPYQDVYTKNNLRRLRFTYFPYPAEYKIAYQTYTKCKDTCNYEEEVLANIHQFGDGRASAYLSFISEKEVRRSVRNVVTFIKNKNVLETCTQYADRIDMYGLGTAVADISRFISYKGLTTKQLATWKTFVKGTIHSDMRKRFTPKQALNHLEKLRNML